MHQYILKLHTEGMPLPETHHAVCTCRGEVSRRPFGCRTKLGRETKSQREMILMTKPKGSFIPYTLWRMQNATLAIAFPSQNESPVWMWWRKRGPGEWRRVHRCADTTLWWLCRSWLRQGGCSRGSRSCRRSPPSGRAALPGVGRRLWPRF